MSYQSQGDIKDLEGSWRGTGVQHWCAVFAGQLENLDLISAKDDSNKDSCNPSIGHQQTRKQVDRKMQSFSFYLPSVCVTCRYTTHALVGLSI